MINCNPSAPAMMPLKRMCLKIEIPTEDIDDYCYRRSAINKITRWLVSRGFLVRVIVLWDNLNETALEIQRHCDGLKMGRNVTGHSVSVVNRK